MALKVLEVVAEADAPDADYKTLLQQHPSEITQETRLQQLKDKEERQTRLEGLQQEVDSSSLTSQSFAGQKCCCASNSS